jgi:general secretion pathway protein L
MTKFIGIDIGNASVKVAIVSNTKKGPYIESANIYNLPIDPHADRELAILEILKKLKDHHLGQDCSYYLSIPQSKVAFRFLSFPFSERLKILKTLPFELEENLPFALENAYWDARIVRQFGTESEILIAAVTQYQVKKLMDSIGSLGLNIKKLIPQGNALHNILAPIHELTWKLSPRITEESEVQKKELKLVLDIGHKETTVNVYENNTWINSSAVLWGGWNLIKAIAKSYEIDFDEAYKVVQEKSFVLIQTENATYEQIVFSEILSKELQLFVKELTLMHMSFENTHNGVITELLLTGGGSRLIHLAPFLTQQLEVKVNVLSYLDQWHYSPTLDIHSEPYLSNCIGLALEGFRKSNQPQFQFLQGPFTQKNEALQKFWLLAKDSALWGTGVLATLWIWSSLRVSFSQKLVDDSTERVKEAGQIIANLPPKQSNQNQIRSYIKNARQIILERQVLDQVIHKASALDVLKGISEKFSDKTYSKVQILEVSIVDTLVKLRGTVTSTEEKTKLLNSLKNLSSSEGISDLNPKNPASLEIEFKLKNRDQQ